MDGVSLPQPSTHPFLSSIKGQAKPRHQTCLLPRLQGGPCFMLIHSSIPQCSDACEANLGDEKFTTADKPNFIGLEIIKAFFKNMKVISSNI